MKPWRMALPLCLIFGLSQGAGAKSLTDGTGRVVTVPEPPARVLVMHDPMLAVPILDFGGTVIASYGRNDSGEVLTTVDFIDTVLGARFTGEKPVGIGPVGNPDLERMRALGPDLIIGTEYDFPNVEDYAAVAPTYLQNTGAGRVHGIETQESLASLLDMSAAFEARRDSYLAEIVRIKSEHGLDLSEQSYLTVIVHDQLMLVGEMSGVIQALEDLGYTRAAVSQTGEHNGPGSNFAMPISPEIFMRLNPDIMVLMNSYTARDRSEAAIRDRLDQIAPGWERFFAPEREGRVLYLDSAKVTTPTVASAEHTLVGYEAWLNAK